MGYSHQGHASKWCDHPEKAEKNMLRTLVVYVAMQLTLYWANWDVGHSIDLNSMVDCGDHCIHNCSVCGTGIGVSRLLVGTIHVYITSMVMDNKNIRTNYTGVYMWVQFHWYSTLVILTWVNWIVQTSATAIWSWDMYLKFCLCCPALHDFLF